MSDQLCCVKHCDVQLVTSSARDKMKCDQVYLRVQLCCDYCASVKLY